jgi:hypothetical protein
MYGGTTRIEPLTAVLPADATEADAGTRRRVICITAFRRRDRKDALPAVRERRLAFNISRLYLAGD